MEGEGGREKEREQGGWRGERSMSRDSNSRFKSTFQEFESCTCFSWGGLSLLIKNIGQNVLELLRSRSPPDSRP